MAKLKTGSIILLFICFLHGAAGQSVLEDYPILYETIKLRLKLVDVALSQNGVREKTGKNDGPEIRKYLREVGLPEGYPYCAAGLTWCHNQLNIPNPESAWSPDWFKTNQVYHKNHIRLKEFVSRPGQVAGFYSETKKRISHVAMITGESKIHYFTFEFNTNGQGSDDGQGNRELIRKKESVFAISDYVGYAEIKMALKSK